MKSRLLLCLCALCALAACKNNGYQKINGAYEIKVFSVGKGEKPKEGSMIKVEYVIKNEKDSVLESSRVRNMGQPLSFVLKRGSSDDGMFQSLSMLREGDSAIVKVKADSLFKGHDLPPGIVKNSSLYFHWHMLHVYSEQEKVAEDKKRNDELHARFKDQLMKDSLAIQSYIQTHNLKNVRKTPGGVYYIIEEQGTGAMPVQGDLVSANYVGQLTNGEVFDKSKGQPIEFPVGAGQVIPGWDESFALLNKGTKAKLIIPSIMAYGPRASAGIPPNSVLVFDVEVVDIKHNEGGPAAGGR